MTGDTSGIDALLAILFRHIRDVKLACVWRPERCHPRTIAPELVLADRARAQGRKAWLFAGSDRGGERVAPMYSLIAAICCPQSGAEQDERPRHPRSERSSGADGSQSGDRGVIEIAASKRRFRMIG
jgi:hypothetical protein